jgi:transglutaminase-like putative cysteine protease/sugar lactone lactonase YvrE
MKATRSRILAVAPLTLALTSAALTHAAPGDVATSFDAPCRYPAGMATDGTSLFVADWREAKIFKVNPTDGQVLGSWDAPTLKPHGMTFADGRLVVSDDHTGGIFMLNLETGIVERVLQAPASRAAGLAYADGTLFILTRRSIFKVLPEDGTILGYYDLPTRSSKCLAHDGTYLWISDRVTNELYMADPETGKVINILPAPGPYAAGIAWLDGHLWNADFQNRKLYRLVIQDDPGYYLKEPRRARVEYLWALNNYGPGDVTDLTLSVALPMELPAQTLLTEPEFSAPISETVTDRWDQPCAVFRLDRAPAGTKATLTYSIQAEVSAIRYLLMPEAMGTLDDIPTDIRERYTVDSSHYRIETPYIQETVKKIVGDETNPYWIARKIYDFIIDKLEYEMIGGWDVPEVVLKRGSGSCSEYTYSFVTLCRAAGLPARYQGSIVVRGDDASIDEAFHRWAQIYLPGHGWVPVDANRGDAKSPADQARGFGGLSNRFLITTQGGGDSEYMRFGYNAHATYKTTGHCRVEEDTFGFWEPLEAEGDEPQADSADAKASRTSAAGGAVTKTGATGGATSDPKAAKTDATAGATSDPKAAKTDAGSCESP